MNLYLTPTRRELLRGVANLEISLEESGNYYHLGTRKVNAALRELEHQGWISMGGDVPIPRITMEGSLALLDAEASEAKERAR